MTEIYDLEKIQEWIVVWENGNHRRYVPYDSIGMTAFIRRGLTMGKVTVNGDEVTINEDGVWSKKV